MNNAADMMRMQDFLPLGQVDGSYARGLHDIGRRPIAQAENGCVASQIIQVPRGTHGVRAPCRTRKRRAECDYDIRDARSRRRQDTAAQRAGRALAGADDGSRDLAGRVRGVSGRLAAGHALSGALSSSEEVFAGKWLVNGGEYLAVRLATQDQLRAGRQTRLIGDVGDEQVDVASQTSEFQRDARLPIEFRKALMHSAVAVQDPRLKKSSRTGLNLTDCVQLRCQLQDS